MTTTTTIGYIAIALIALFISVAVDDTPIIATTDTNDRPICVIGNHATIDITQTKQTPTPEPKAPTGTRAYLEQIAKLWGTDIEGLYLIDVVDCSDMSAFMVSMLDANGFDAHLISGNVSAYEVTIGDTTYIMDEPAYHMWVGVYLNDSMVYIEATTGDIIQDSIIIHYETTDVWDDVNDYIYTESINYTKESVLKDVSGMHLVKERLISCGWNFS